MCDTTYHSAAKLSGVDKVSSLKDTLQEAACKFMKGLEMINNNYKVAISVLHERFNNREQIIHTCFYELMELPAATGQTN